MREKWIEHQFHTSTGNMRRRRCRNEREVEFLCRNCHQIVSTAAEYSGVQNRNHCPYCLHSRHVDMIEAGDRLSACKAVMRPVGLTSKHVTNKYGGQCGELMLIHLCMDCGKVSINRIACDDDAELIYEYFQNSFEMRSEQKVLLKERGIDILGKDQTEYVIRRLFGKVGIVNDSSI